MNLIQARENMIEQQIRPWDVLDQRILDALATIPRERFVDGEHRGIAYSDYELPIGHGQSMLKPNLDGRLLQALDISPTDSLLEIGTGSGFLTTCLSRLGRKVQSVEIIPELSQSATELLGEMGVSNAHCLTLDASLEWDADDQYEGIVFTGSLTEIPEFYLEKMAINGRLCAILGSSANPTMEAVLITRIAQTEWLRDSLFETSAPPLVNFSAEESEKAFKF